MNAKKIRRTKVTTIQIVNPDPKLYEVLKNLADQDGRSLSKMTEILLRQHLTSKKLI